MNFLTMINVSDNQGLLGSGTMAILILSVNVNTHSLIVHH